MHIDLRRGQADALGVVHGLEHVFHQGLDALIHLRHGLGNLVKTGIGIAEDGKNGHGVSVNLSLLSQHLTPNACHALNKH